LQGASGELEVEEEALEVEIPGASMKGTAIEE